MRRADLGADPDIRVTGCDEPQYVVGVGLPHVQVHARVTQREHLDGREERVTRVQVTGGYGQAPAFVAASQQAIIAGLFAERISTRLPGFTP